MTTMTNLLTIDEAIARRLQYIDERDHQRELARQAEEARIDALRVEFAQALSRRIAADFGLAIDASERAPYVEQDHQESFKFRMPVDSPPDEGRPVEAMIYTRYSTTLEALRRGEKWQWMGVRCIRRQRAEDEEEDRHPLIDECKTSDLIEAITFAKTGKQ